jgi:hypothetical protein
MRPGPRPTGQPATATLRTLGPGLRQPHRADPPDSLATAALVLGIAAMVPGLAWLAQWAAQAPVFEAGSAWVLVAAALYLAPALAALALLLALVWLLWPGRSQARHAAIATGCAVAGLVLAAMAWVEAMGHMA